MTRDPHLAVLSVMAHGGGDDVRAAVAVALAATSGAAGLPEPMRAPRYGWFAEGEARGEARSILRILDRRGIAVSPEQRERILACADAATLEGWLDRALVAKSAEELFVGGTP